MKKNLQIPSGNKAVPGLDDKQFFKTHSTKLGFLLLVLFSLTTLTAAFAQRQMENLNRGVVAVRTSPSAVFVSWRLLGTEPQDMGFNLYRGETKLNETPITGATNYVDNSNTDETYAVAPVINGVEQEKSAPATVWTQNHLTIPIQQPAGGTTPDGVNYTYTANDCSTGDLDGDGEYEIVLKWDPTNSKDNSQSGYTGNVIIDAYKMNGTRLWRIDLGKNIRAGAHYTQFIVYDLDSDGKAEVAFKTADGTVDGVGTVIGNAGADYRNGGGYILDGPEFLTVFNGETGAAMATTDYVPARGNVADWGDNYGNRVDRFLAGVGYFDGQRPSLVMSRGYYTRTVIAAWDWRNGQLSQRWVFDSNGSGNEGYAGQGNHSLSINDVDGDGKDEVVFGSMAVDDNGMGLYTTGLGHGDAQHVGDLDPTRPGLESWSAHENVSAYDGNGLWMRDAGTGEKLWGVPATGDIGRALAADIDPNHLGYEAWGSAGSLYNVKGQEIAASKPKMNFTIWWDGDLLREILDGDIMDKWNYETNSLDRLFTIYQTGASKINGTKANPNLTADILGDWREEMVYRHWDNTKLMVYTTTIPTTERIYTLMHDSQYRTSVAWQNVAYNQPPHTSFYLGHGMEAPPVPQIALVENEGPGAPIIYLAASGGDAKVDLSWSVTNAELGSLEVYRDKDADPNGRTRIAILGGAARTYTDNTANNDTTYYYWIKAKEAGTGVTISSNAANATPKSDEPVVLPGVELSAAAVNDAIELNWEVTGFDTRGQEVYRDTDSNPSGRSRVASIGGSERSFTDANVEDGVTYYYWIKATATDGTVVNSSTASATAEVGGAPSLPEVVLEAAGVYGRIDLNWAISNIEVRGMDLLRDTDPDPSGRGRIASLGADARSYKDESAEVGVTYYYWVKVTDTALATHNSNTAGATAKAWPTIELLAAGGDAQVSLSWVVSNTELSRMEVYRDTDSNPSGRGRIASLGGDARDFVDNTAENGVSYWYWIKAWDLDGIQLGSEAATATPVPPASVALSATGKDARVELSWEVLNVVFSNQEVYRDEDDNPNGRVRIASLGGDIRSYTDETAINGTTYYYWIKGKDANQVATNSNAAMATPVPLDGTYQISIRHSGKMLDNNKECASGEGNGNVKQNSISWANSPEWTLSSVDSGYYTITNTACGQAMGVKAQSNTAEGANILQWNYSGDVNQQWLVKETAEGYFTIINRGTGMSVTVEEASVEDGANVKQYTYAEAEHQQFTLSPISALESANMADKQGGFGLKQAGNAALVYPNPAKGTFSIRAEGAFNYTIYDQLGRVTLEGNAEGQAVVGDKLRAGLYLISVYVDGKMQQIQLIKQ